MAKLAICSIYVAAMVYSATAAISTKSLAGYFFELGRFEYFSDSSSTLRTREEAKRFCENSAGQLAPVLSLEVYRRLLSRINVNGAYWIDGTESGDFSRFKFEDNSLCASETIDIPTGNVTVSGSNCLVLVKPTVTTQTHRIEAVNCNTRARVLCAQVLQNCPATTTTPGASTTP